MSKLALIVSIVGGLLVILEADTVKKIVSFRDRPHTEELVGRKDNGNLVDTQSCFGPEGRGGPEPTLYFPERGTRVEGRMVQCEHLPRSPEQAYSFSLPELDSDGKLEAFKGVLGIDHPKDGTTTEAVVSWKIKYRGKLVCDLTLQDVQTQRCKSRSPIAVKEGAPLLVTQTLESPTDSSIFAGVIDPSVGWTEPRVPLRLVPGLVLFLGGIVAFVAIRRRRKNAQMG